MPIPRELPILAIVLVLAACAAPAPATATLLPPPPPPSAVPVAATRAPRTPVSGKPIANGPTLLWSGIALRKVSAVGAGNLRLAFDTTTRALLMLSSTNEIFLVKLDPSAPKTRLYSAADIGIPKGATVSGMRLGPDGTLYVVFNAKPDTLHIQATVRKGVPGSDGVRAWSTLVQTEPYEASNTNFDHLVNGIAVSPDGANVFINAGSRTDHGEVQTANGNFPKLRDVALTAKILRVPASAQDLALPNDAARLRAGGWIYAEGTRNAYDLAFAPNGDLFGVDNGPDADLPDELNWLREGRHYGFPWQFGIEPNPQQFANYDSSNDKRLREDFVAVKSGTYRNDPGFPPAPGQFTDPVINRGPAGAQYRAADGSARDAAAERGVLNTFTPHRSPLGLAFASDPAVPDDLRATGGGLSLFVASWGAAGGTLTDQGQDVLHMALEKKGDNYEAVTRQIAKDFKRPIDMIMIGNRLYVLEFEGDAAIWELTLN